MLMCIIGWIVWGLLPSLSHSDSFWTRRGRIRRPSVVRRWLSVRPPRGKVSRRRIGA